LRRPDHTANTATERKRRLRERQRRGEIVVGCVVDNAIIGLLIDLGWLDVDESEDRNEIAVAVMAALRSAIGEKSGTRGQSCLGKHGL
jgi:hypothetical protein